MHLKKIRLFGFKSFADKTELHFHEGITGIVGPNGCGKSNIADAFRWVLGEQSAKSMRGDKMFDVIFSGTNTRKPLNIAEVTLVLTDINGTLPVEYEEVEVTRRIYRTGESDYYINQKPVRMKDVQSLFMDSGIGKDAFAIFEQGKIDQVINYSPLERRYIFEETAGIVRFLQRKKEALRKLDQAEANVARVKDIHQEVEKRIIVLESQVEKAKLFKENKEKLESLEKGLFVAKWDQLEKRKASQTSDQSEEKDKIAALQADYKTKEREFHEERVFLGESERILRAKVEVAYEVKGELNLLQREKESLQANFEEAKRDRERKEKELSLLVDQKQIREKEKKGAQDQLGEKQKSLQILDEERKKVFDEWRSLENEVSLLRKDTQEEQRELIALVQKEKQLESEMKGHAIRLEGTVSRQMEMDRQKEIYKTSRESLLTTLEKKKEELNVISSQVDQKKLELEQVDKTLCEMKEAIKEKESLVFAARRKLHELEAREKALQRLKNDMEGITSGSRRLLQEAKKETSPLFQKLTGIWESFSLEGDHSLALSSVMRNYTDTLVVQTKSDLEAVLDYVKKQEIKDFSLICLELLPATLNQSFIDDVAFVETSQDALTLLDTRGQIFAKEGLFIDRNKVLFFYREGEKNTFLREAELKKLSKEIGKERLSLNTEEEALKNLVQKRDQASQQKATLEKELKGLEVTLMELSLTTGRMKEDYEKATKEEEKTVNDLQSLDQLALELQKVMQTLEQKHLEEKAKVDAFHQKVHAKAGQLEEVAEKEKALQQELKTKETATEKCRQEVRNLEHTLDVIEVKEIESARQQERLEIELKELQGGFEDKKTREISLVEKIEHISEQKKKVESEKTLIETQVEERKKMLLVIEQELSEIREKVKTLEEGIQSQAIRLAQIESTREALEQELLERYHCTVDEMREMSAPLEKSIEASEKELRACRRFIEEAGDVNMTSIEEEGELKERYQFLNQQLDDLETSKQELIQIITELDGESRKIFKEVFEKIRTNFQKNFQILFNGGEADLHLTESEDILEAGVDILAKPPGKQMRSIQLMSGGEKCLTSIALLFAIFEVKPAPFCILDEIDAPLDDINIDRFLNVVRQFTDRCQFIIITHNKRTMAIADRLFGVSMEERGVSKLLAMEFSKEESPEPVLV